MKKNGFGKISAAFLSFIILISSAAVCFADTDISLEKSETAEYILNTVKAPQIGSIGGEWSVIGLARSGCAADSFFDSYTKSAAEQLKTLNGVLSERKYTEYSRVILALTSLGINPESFSGYNLLYPLGDFEKTTLQGVNGSIFALIALDSGNYEIPYNQEAKLRATRDMYIDAILSSQLENGGWAFSASSDADTDLTAMALQALSRYKNTPNVSSAVDKALLYISQSQKKSGGFEAYSNESSESSAQVIIALCSLGISLNDTRFVKNGFSVLDSLLSYKNPDGSFSHTKGGAANLMATEQALCALSAAERYSQGAQSLYDMTDVKADSDNPNQNLSDGLPEKNAAVKKQPVLYFKTFDDIANNANRAETEALASRGIINGKTDALFDPDSTMTRAEFAAIIDRALGIDGRYENPFSDISDTDWFADYVSAAYNFKIINGVSETEFNPNGTITKEEAMCMTARAAALCGMTVKVSDNEIQNTLAEFTDYIKISGWAKESAAFCVKSGIVSNDDIEINPDKCITRCEVAAMVYNMLDRSALL